MKHQIRSKRNIYKICLQYNFAFYNGVLTVILTIFLETGHLNVHMKVFLITLIMYYRKNWSQEEDQALLKLIDYHSNDKRSLERLKWNQIASQLNNIFTAKSKNGKQCRQRWHGWLNPELAKSQPWSKQSEKLLFELQQINGNQWVKISKYFVGKSDNNVKNYFYSYLRKSLRMINTYIQIEKKSKGHHNLKPFQETNLNKILSVAQNKCQQKIIILNDSVFDLAKTIKLLLIQLQVVQQQQAQEKQKFYDNLIIKIQEFNRNSKKRKEKKKNNIKQIKDKPFKGKTIKHKQSINKSSINEANELVKQQEIQFCHRLNYQQMAVLNQKRVKQEDQQNNQMIVIQRQEKAQYTPAIKEENNQWYIPHSQYRPNNISLFYDPKLFSYPFSFYPPQPNHIFYPHYSHFNLKDINEPTHLYQKRISNSSQTEINQNNIYQHHEYGIVIKEQLSDKTIFYKQNQ